MCVQTTKGELDSAFRRPSVEPDTGN